MDGIGGKTYENCPFHRIIDRFMIQGRYHSNLKFVKKIHDFGAIYYSSLNKFLCRRAYEIEI